MNRLLTLLWLYCRYALYVALTQRERTMYDAGTARGMHCDSMKDVGCLPGSTFEFRYRSGVKPYRLYKTWPEWKADNTEAAA